MAILVFDKHEGEPEDPAVPSVHAELAAHDVTGVRPGPLIPDRRVPHVFLSRRNPIILAAPDGVARSK